MNIKYRTLAQILLDVIREKNQQGTNSLDRVIYCVEQLCRFSSHEIDDEINHLVASGKIRLDGGRVFPRRQFAGKKTSRSHGRSAPSRVSGGPAGSFHKAGFRRFRVNYATKNARVA